MIRTPGTQGMLDTNKWDFVMLHNLCYILYANCISYAAYSMMHSKNLKGASRNPRTRTTTDQDYFPTLPNPTNVHRPSHP